MRDKNEPDSTHKYKSPFTGEYIQAHQYIGEILVSRKAQKDGVNLTYKYWLNEDYSYKKDLKLQIQQAGKLLKKYTAKAIMQALNQNSWCYSLMNPTVLNSIKVCQDALDFQEKQQKNPEIKIETVDSFARANINKGKFDKWKQ